MKFQIHKCSIILALFITVPAITGCKGPASRKAAVEALEIIERKGASKAGSAIEREATQIERNAAKEAESYHSGRTRTYRPRYNSDDNDVSYQPQVQKIQCPSCGGSGLVYILDYYGNIQYDYYGSPIVGQCQACGGNGYFLVSE